MNEEILYQKSEKLSEMPENGSGGKAAFPVEPLAALAAAASYAAAYCYLLWFESHRLMLPVVAVLLVTVSELIHRKTARSAESYIWLGCFACACIGGTRCNFSVWNGMQLSLFVHIFFVWWVLSRSGKLLEGRSGHLLPADALNGLILIPFGNFFLRVRILCSGLRQLLPTRDAEQRKRGPWMLLAAALCICLFVGAVRLLMAADAGFLRLAERIAAWLRADWELEVLLRFLLSLPVGAWLFGLIGGTERMPEERLKKQRCAIAGFLEKLQKVPGGFWMAVIGAFSALYLVFFVIQGSYLFGAFSRTLPEGFIVSEYARQGFFELCRVMAVNFALLWLVTRMASPETTGKRSFTWLCVLLLTESMVFAVIAFSKLALYISCFGFTPLRLQSSWLVCVLFAGCGLWIYHIFSGRPAFRKWMIFGGATLAVLCLF